MLIALFGKTFVIKRTFFNNFFFLDLECILWLEQSCSEVAHVSGADESEMLDLCFGFFGVYFFNFLNLFCLCWSWLQLLPGVD